MVAVLYCFLNGEVSVLRLPGWRSPLAPRFLLRSPLERVVGRHDVGGGGLGLSLPKSTGAPGRLAKATAGPYTSPPPCLMQQKDSACLGWSLRMFNKHSRRFLSLSKSRN